MKNIITFLFLTLSTLVGLRAQDDFTVYNNNVTGSTIGGVFNDDVLFVEPISPNSSKNFLKSNYFVSKEIDGNNLVPSTQTYENFPIDITSVDPKELMAMYHLNMARLWALGESLPAFPYPFDVPITVVSSSTNFNPIVQANEDLLDPMLEYGVADPGNPNAHYESMAEDAYAIVRAYFMLTFQAHANGDQITGDGADLAIGTYFAHRYMTDFGYNTTSEAHSWGGTSGNPLNTMAWEPIYSDFSTLLFPGFFSPPNNNHGASEKLFATLWKLNDQLGADDMGRSKLDRLIVNSFSSLVEEQNALNDQSFLAVKLYDNSFLDLNSSYLNDEDRCDIFKIFRFVYGSDFVLKIADTSILPGGAKDFIIRDSYEGQSHWQHGVQGEDTGIEPNDITTAFSSCPEIWNRTSNESMITKEHQNPEYTDENTYNYLYVDVRVKSCEIPENNEKLRVYIRGAHIGGVWPDEWTNGSVNGVQVGYEITEETNGIPLSDYKSTFTEENPASTSADDEYWTVYRYEIPWIPINPDQLAGIPDADGNILEYGEIWACILARIDTETEDGSGSDPMTFAEGPGAWTNSVNNNNISIRNTSIHLSDEFEIGGPGGSTSSVLDIISPYEDTGGTGGTGTPNPEVDIEIAVHPNAPYTNDGDPIIPSTDGPGDPVIFDFVGVEIIMTEELSDAIEEETTTMTGFERVDRNTIRVTSPRFAIRGLKLPPRKMHRLIVRTTNKKAFTSVDFSLLMKNSEGRTVGSQTYNSRGSLWKDRNDTKGKTRSDALQSDEIPNLQVHPNPAQEYVTVTSADGKIRTLEVFDFAGKEVSVNFKGTTEQDVRVDIGSLRAGIYFLRADVDGQLQTTKFVKL